MNFEKEYKEMDKSKLDKPFDYKFLTWRFFWIVILIGYLALAGTLIYIIWQNIQANMY